MTNYKTQTFGFFLLLFVLLFVGDGPSSYVDVVGAAVIIIISLVTKYYGKQERTLPRSLLTPWVFFLLFAGASMFWSIDVGASLRSFTRYVEGFIVYYVFFVYTPKNEDGVFMKAIVMLASLTALSALFFVFVPTSRSVLPSMNLLWSNYGHNHVTDIWLIALFPTLSVFLILKKLRYVVLVLLWLVFVLSQARAALGLVFFAIASFLMLTDTIRFFGRRGLFVILTVFIVALIGIYLVPELSFIPKQTPLPMREKTPLASDRRIEYWRQALYSIRERPIIGSGTGTFVLLSSKHQSKPSNSSWFAHNYILETTAELGVVGVMLLIWVLYVCYFRPAVNMLVRREETTHKLSPRLAILLSPLLLLTYGLVDFSLNYFVVWILLWASIGVSTRA